MVSILCGNSVRMAGVILYLYGYYAAIILGVLMVESVRMTGVIPLWLLCYYVTRCANIGECEDGWGDTSMVTMVLCYKVC